MPLPVYLIWDHSDLTFDYIRIIENETLFVNVVKTSLQFLIYFHFVYLPVMLHINFTISLKEKRTRHATFSD